MNIKLFVSVVAISALLSGCMSFGEQRAAPVTDSSTQRRGAVVDSELGEDETIQIRAYEPAAPVAATTEPIHSSAVTALLDQARSQELAGDFNSAIGTVERAVRIEPRNAHLWNRLAHLRMEQKRPGLAEDLAAKSTALAGADVELKRDNWLLIARAKRLAGDAEGARVAERKARMLY